MHARKYLFYMHALAGGGAERVWALLASEFARRGHDVTFAVDFHSPENMDFLDARVRVVTLPSGHFRAVLGLASLLRREKPDVTLSGIGVSNLKHMLAALMAFRHRRAVLSFHGFFASEPQFLSRLGNHLAPILTRLCGRAVAVSDGLRTALIEQHHASARRVVRIYNPVYSPKDASAVTAADLAARGPIVLYVGRMHADKDIPTLLRGFSRVTFPGAQLEIVGDGALRGEMEALAASLGIADRVTFCGYQSDPSIAYRRARVLALTSRRESFGNVVAEALEHGLPVVTTATDGPCEILEHGRYGTIVGIGDDETLARALDAALANPGDPAPRIAQAKLFAVDKATEAYLALTEEVIREA